MAERKLILTYVKYQFTKLSFSVEYAKYYGEIF